MSQATILLADDEETLRENLVQVLTEEGFNVISCGDGTEALSALKSNTVDAIITDLRMPGIPGMELIDHAAELAVGQQRCVALQITNQGQEFGLEPLKQLSCRLQRRGVIAIAKEDTVRIDLLCLFH